MPSNSEIAMKKVTTHESLAYIGHLKNLLEQSDIHCIVRNDQLSGGLGEIPFLECLPELWVLEDNDEGRAKTLLQEIEAPNDSTGSWQCSHCAEINEGQFAACWHCGTQDSRGDVK
jgi:hypothetical protein